QPERRDTVGQDAAGLVERLKDRDGVAGAGELGCSRQPCRAGSHDRHTLPGRPGGLGEVGTVLPLPVSHEPFERADPDGGLLDAEDAGSLTLRLLRAYPPADGGEHVLLLERPCGPGEVSFRDLADERGDIDADRAALYTERLFALEA